MNPTSKPIKALFLLALISAILLNLGLLRLYHHPTERALIGDEERYLSRAKQVAASQPVDHHPFWPPLYPELMGQLFGQFGEDLLSIQIAQMALWLLSGFLFGDIAATVFSSRGVGNITLALFLLNPELIAFSHFLWPEILHLFCFAVSLWLLVRWPRRWVCLSVSGIFLGLALLAKQLLLLFIPVILVFVLIKSSGSRKARLGKAAVLCFSLIATAFPAAILTPGLQGYPISAGSGIFNLWVGLNDKGHRDYENLVAGREFVKFDEAGSTFSERNRLLLAKIMDLTRERGFISILRSQFGKQYFRLFHYETTFTSQLPGGPRQRYTFDSPSLATSLRVYGYLVHGLILGSGVMGLFLLRLRPLGWQHLFLLFLVYNLGLFSFLHVKTRYLVQILPILIIFSSLSLHGAFQAWKQGPQLGSSLSGWTNFRLAGATVCLLAIEWLAFGNLLSPC